MTKVSNESSALASKHQLDADIDEPYDHDSADVLGSEVEEEQEDPSVEIAVESTGPIFAELDSLLWDAPEQHREQKDSLETTLARAVRSMAESQEEAEAIAEQLLSGDEIEDPSHSAWCRSALESLRSETSSAKKSAAPAGSLGMSPKAALTFHSTKPSARRSMIAGHAPPVDRRFRTMSCAG
mmetsp:Transcript_31171/g.46476  ORF Transcript_31171/g.46476 Transcript_31171/m.46476 type:complete len:183 (+) Transcript_31171:3-551(+)